MNSEPDYIALLESLRWNGIVVSPYHPLSKVYKCGSRYKCSQSNRYFNVRTNTIFQNSRIDLKTWFQAIQLISNNPNTRSPELAAALNVSQKTAWAMIRKTKKHFGSFNKRDENTPNITIDTDKLKLADWFQILKK